MFVEEKDFPDAVAEYVAKVQWAEPRDSDLMLHHEKENTPFKEGRTDMKEAALTIQESDEVINAQKE